MEVNGEQELDLPAEVAQLQYGRFWIEQKVLRFDVSMADAERMNVGQCTKQLIHV